MRILEEMQTNKFGEKIYNETDAINLLLEGNPLTVFNQMTVDDSIDLETAALILDDVPTFIKYNSYAEENLSQEDFDHRNQKTWLMPQKYKDLDIAAHILSLCKSEPELQRCGEELLEYQEQNLFDLLRYMTYLVDIMKENRLIWGVGRGSSVSSFVLYKLGVHRIDSLLYELDFTEFLRPEKTK
jgi:DNA polymerase III alpha subunit